MKKVISIFLIAVFIMQSCVVYQQIPVSLDNAVEQGNAKVITTSYEELKFREILNINDSTYMGVNNENETLVLNEDLIYRIYLKSEPKSNLATITLILLSGVTVFMFVGIVAYFKFMSDWSNRMSNP